MAIAAPVTASDLSAAGHARRTRVAVAGATGYAGQELVRLLARHPAVTLTAAMSSGASSTPRPLPALARIWDDAVMPLDIDHLVASADIVFLALPEAASADVAPKLLERGMRVIDLSGAFPNPRRRGSPALVSGDAVAAGGNGVRPARTRRRRLSRMRVSCRVPAAIRPPRCSHSNRCRMPASSKGGHRRRQVGHLGRRQGAERPHALLGEPRQRRGVRRLLSSSQRRDRAGAEARRDVRSASRAARSRHSRDDLRVAETWHHRGAGRPRARGRVCAMPRSSG
mgnify:CR=1 FL=1